MDPQAPHGNSNVTPIPTMQFHNPTIPTLNIDNVAPWTIAIQCEAQAMGIYDQVMNNNYEPDPYLHRSVAALTSTIISSLPTDIAAALITHGTPINPARLIQQVHRHVSRQSESDQLALEMEAENTVPAHFDSIDKFFDAHDKLRTRMLTARCHGIDNERSTIKIILKILRDDPTFESFIVQWITNPPTSIKDLRAKAKAICNIQHKTGTSQSFDFGSSSTRHNLKPETTPARNTIPDTFCRYHASKGRILPHADNECRDSHNPKSPNYRPPYRPPPTPRTSQSGHTNQSTRSYNIPNRRAQAAAQEQYSNRNQTPTDSVTSTYNAPPGFDDTKSSASYDDFDGKSRRILDSAAFPTHTPRTHPNMHPSNQKDFTMTANGSHVPISHTGSITIPSPAGPLPTEAVTTPTIPDTLVSVHDITHPDKAIIFTHKKAWITKKSQLKKACSNFTKVATWKKNAYCIDPNPATRNPQPNQPITSQPRALYKTNSDVHRTPTRNPNHRKPLNQRHHTHTSASDHCTKANNVHVRNQTASPPSYTNHTNHTPMSTSNITDDISNHEAQPNPTNIFHHSPQVRPKPKTQKPNHTPTPKHTIRTPTHAINSKLLTANPEHTTTNRRLQTMAAWHLALNHAPISTLRKISTTGMFPALTAIGLTSNDIITCASCYTGKLTRTQFHHATPKTQRPGEHIVSDTMGPITPTSRQGHRHILTIIDGHSRYAFTIPIKSRTEVPSTITRIMTMIQNKHGQAPLHFHSDNAPEFLSKHIGIFLTSTGTAQTTTVPYHPQLNGIAERLNRTISEAARCALAHSQLPANLWNYAMIDATWKYNILPHTQTNTPPAQRWERDWQPPQYILPFGTKGSIPDFRTKTKLADRARPVRFLHNISNSIIAVLHSDTGQTGTVRLNDFRPHHPALDPSMSIASAFKAFRIQPIPTKIDKATPPHKPSLLHTSIRTHYNGKWLMMLSLHSWKIKTHLHGLHQTKHRNTVSPSD